jgi:hypothetical protein
MKDSRFFPRAELRRVVRVNGRARLLIANETGRRVRFQGRSCVCLLRFFDRLETTSDPSRLRQQGPIHSEKNDMNAHDAASSYGLDISQAELLADDEATKIWTITAGEEVFFATARGEFTTLARTTAAELATRAYTVLIEDEGTAAQYVIVDEAHMGAARAVGGLRELTSGVFVDDAVNARASSEVTTLRGDADSMSPGYDLALFAPEAK